MPANNDYPILDGIAPSWADIIVRATPADAPLIEMKDIAAINTGCTVELGEQTAGGRLKRRTTGSSKYEASLTLYHHGWISLLRQLKTLAARRGSQRGSQRIYSLVHFGLNIQWTPMGVTEIFEARIKGARIVGRTLNGSEGNDPNKVEVGLSVVEIVEIVDGEELVIL